MFINYSIGVSQWCFQFVHRSSYFVVQFHQNSGVTPIQKYFLQIKETGTIF
jgi:hypothetical protein